MNRLMGFLAGRLGLHNLTQQIEEQKILLGRQLALQIRQLGVLNSIQEAEFKVFSQFGDDGIIQYLIQQTGISADERTFIEFGVQDYLESNTRFLLLNDYWRGMVLDIDADAIRLIQGAPYYWRANLKAVCACIQKDNVNQLFAENGFTGDLGLLSVDIDGNDYWVWQAIEVVRPVIVVAEYNATFGSRRAVSVPYDPKFYRTRAHASNLYWGTSLKALELVGKEKGYAFVGTNAAGNNAYFVRRDRLGQLSEIDVETGYTSSCFRESRGPSGELTFLTGDDRLRAIADMPLVDVATGSTIKAKELIGGI